MIVERMTVYSRTGQSAELVELLKAERKRNGGSYRICSCQYGPRNAIVVEWEAEDVAERQKAWADWNAQPEAAAFSEKWVELVESGGTSEIWKVH